MHAPNQNPMLLLSFLFFFFVLLFFKTSRKAEDRRVWNYMLDHAKDYIVSAIVLVTHIFADVGDSHWMERSGGACQLIFCGGREGQPTMIHGLFQLLR